MKRTEAEKNSKFVKMWGTKRKLGRNKYVLLFILMVTAGLLIGRIGITLYTGNDFDFAVIAGLIIGGLIGSVIGGILGWYANEKKYNDIIEKQYKEENTMINSDHDI